VFIHTPWTGASEGEIKEHEAKENSQLTTVERGKEASGRMCNEMPGDDDARLAHLDVELDHGQNVSAKKGADTRRLGQGGPTR
jgi:hypothetical protein